MLRCIQNSCDARLKLFSQCRVKFIRCINLLFAFLKISSSKYYFCLIILDIILGFGETIASPWSRFLNFVSLMDPYNSSLSQAMWTQQLHRSHSLPCAFLLQPYYISIKETVLPRLWIWLHIQLPFI